MNYIDFFFIYIYMYKRKSIDTKFDKTFHTCCCGKHGFQTRTIQTTKKKKCLRFLKSDRGSTEVEPW